ncbi:PilW family protein [Paenibacillus agricola]|uniref:Prepilin-type N-terminal cleavage/methylation domain-containing protein n=1 Tax=Paenibacillus agricola TaxID=2716264 RepID=A0ABX0J782_9BACL|nr:hypothetical protein [Paenibacillus agricola]NHN30732.1 hypothetical protein [Paenibacillus agricola]
MKILNQKAISLIEVLAAITLTAIVIGVITAVIYQTNQGFSKITTRESVQENGRIITEHIVNQVRSARYLVTSTHDENNHRHSVLTLQAINAQGAATGDTVRYNFVSPNLTVTITINGVAHTMTLTTQLEQADFIYLAPSVVDINLQFKANSKPYYTSVRLPSW